jgi:hypothetical protein
MTRDLFRIGTLVAILATIASGRVPNRDERGARRDERLTARGQGRALSVPYCPMCDVADVPKRLRPVTIHPSNYCVFCERTPSGRIRRSSSARRAFQELHTCPATGLPTGTCPGYIIDHVVPLFRGGADSPENMQWQNREDARAKDRVE